MIVISITVIKNNISVNWLKYSRLVSWFHWTHDVNVASRMPWQGIGAIELRARKKPVLLGPCPPGYGTQLHRSVLEDKTQLWEWGDQESQSRYAVVLLLSAVAWLQVHQPHSGSGSLAQAWRWHWLLALTGDHIPIHRVIYWIQIELE